MKCPVCNDGIMKEGTYAEMIYVPFCTEVRQIQLKDHKCNLCDCEICDDGNEKKVAKIRDILTKKSTSHMLRVLSKRYHSFMNMERVLDIPFGTFKKWYNKETVPTPAELTLLRFLMYDKDLIKIAANRFR